LMKTCQFNNKTKHPKKKGEKKVQDGRTQVLANEEITKGGKLLGYMNKSSIQTL